MRRTISTAVAIAMCMSLVPGCGPRQTGSENIDTRPLEESKAASIIEEILTERGYTWTKDAPVSLSNGVTFNCDYVIKGESIAIEYLTETDRRMMGTIPPRAEGSRLHVVAGRLALREGEPPVPLYVFFIDARKFVYHFNPTSEVRADVTFLEVDSRLRRDLADFLSWYEGTKGAR
jgi:hypothetical protein